MNVATDPPPSSDEWTCEGQSDILELLPRPKLLDLCCCQGSASEGYRRAGFDVTGVDIDPQPRYPFPFVQADAIAVLRGEIPEVNPLDFDVIHASFPCQGYSRTNNMPGTKGVAPDFPRLVPEGRALLEATGVTWVMENVIGAPMPLGVLFCGRAYGLGTARHRLFESSALLMSAGCACGREPSMPICGHGTPSSYRLRTGRSPKLDERRIAAGAPPWVDRDGLRESIPIAYTQHVGEQLMDALELERAA